jgi:hypothetical protein
LFYVINRFPTLLSEEKIIFDPLKQLLSENRLFSAGINKLYDEEISSIANYRLNKYAKNVKSNNISLQ